MLGKIFNWGKTPTGSASAAKERLQIIVSHQGQKSNPGISSPSYVENLQSELISVIAKYVKVDENQVKVSLENSGKSSVLELNVTLPEN